MSKVYKCDCCGKIYSVVHTAQIVLKVDYQLLNEYDICSDCLESFKLWKESRDRNYKTAFEDKEDV